MEERGWETDRAVIVGEVLATIGASEHAVVRETWRQHSNDIGRVELDDGRVLMVKLARFGWAAAGFRAERRAARLLARTDVAAPRHLPVAERVGGRPVLAYWRIELETLASVWPDLDAAGRRTALESWGRLFCRVHDVRVDGVGRLGGAGARSLYDYLARDVGERLRPAVAGAWPAGFDALETALALLPELDRRVGRRAPVLLHGDPHARNVMAARESGQCEGLIDLEGAAGGPREMDLAHLRILHGDLFDHPLPDGWFRTVQAAYGLALDPFALDWFALYHLLNLGFFSAHTGDAWHADAVAGSAVAHADRLRERQYGTAPAA